jgi:type II secretory pathway pseudopilin PulG
MQGRLSPRRKPALGARRSLATARRLGREDGFTLVELLVSASIMIVVLGATLGAFEAFTTQGTVNESANDSQSRARTAIDQLTRKLRNVAAEAPDQQLGIDKATGTDLVFQVVDPTKPSGSLNVKNVRRVRYCLDSTLPTNEKLWTQTQSWTTAATPAVPATASCPDPSWGSQAIVVDHVVNNNGQTRAVWSFDSSQISHISTVTTKLYVDYNPGKPPPEQELDTSVYLRNENQPPVAQFTYVVNPNLSVDLNASDSYDPESGSISYQWFDGTTPIGQGMAFQWEDPGAACHNVTLTVSDDSGASESTTQNVPVGTTCP